MGGWRGLLQSKANCLSRDLKPRLGVWGEGHHGKDKSLFGDSERRCFWEEGGEGIGVIYREEEGGEESIGIPVALERSQNGEGRGERGGLGNGWGASAMGYWK